MSFKPDLYSVVVVSRRFSSLCFQNVKSLTQLLVLFFFLNQPSLVSFRSSLGRAVWPHDDYDDEDDFMWYDQDPRYESRFTQQI